MSITDMHHHTKALAGLTLQTLTTGTVTGEIIDTAGFNSLEFALLSSTITDGAFVVSLLHGNDSGLSDVTAVSAAETLGDADYADTDDDTANRIGYIGKKRYVQLNIVATGATTGGDFAGIAVLGNAAHMPTAD